MQTTSNLYKEILGGNYWVETKLNINGVDFGEDKLMSMKADGGLFSNSPSVGNCIAFQLDVSLRLDSAEIPRAACLRPYVRVCDSTRKSEWIAQGVYYVDTRETDTASKTTELHAFDGMLLFDDFYPSDSTHDYPISDAEMVRFMAQTVGVEVDSRTFQIMDMNYYFPLPTSYTMRECLQMIASAYGGNFIMTEVGKLRLVGLNDIPPETRYLIDNVGYAILFGGDRILV